MSSSPAQLVCRGFMTISSHNGAYQELSIEWGDILTTIMRETHEPTHAPKHESNEDVIFYHSVSSQRITSKPFKNSPQVKFSSESCQHLAVQSSKLSVPNKLTVNSLVWVCSGATTASSRLRNKYSAPFMA